MIEMCSNFSFVFEVNFLLGNNKKEVDLISERIEMHSLTIEIGFYYEQF